MMLTLASVTLPNAELSSLKQDKKTSDGETLTIVLKYSFEELQVLLTQSDRKWQL